MISYLKLLKELKYHLFILLVDGLDEDSLDVFLTIPIITFVILG